MDERTDAELIKSVLSGEVETYAILVRRYRDNYTRFAVRMVGNRDDADEALQRAFLRAYRALPKCEDPGKFGAWLYSIVANQCRTLARQRKKRGEKMIRDEKLMRDQIDGSATPFSDDIATRTEIEHALAQLDPDYREAFVLKHVEELSYEEMAEITGLGISALKMRVKRACEKLQEMLKEEYYV
jgi:RNA polymerase sigma-70 factor (ECF subfamily)